MCGRFYFDPYHNEKMIRLVEKIKNAIGKDMIPNGDVFPGNIAPILIFDDTLKIGAKQWGFSLGDTKKLVINARSESVLQKPMFRDCFPGNRCLIPTSGFYEWKDDHGKKTKYLCGLRDDKEILYLAGLCDKNRERFVVITKEAESGMQQIHERMPLIIPEEHCRKWLSDEESAKNILQGEDAETDLILCLFDLPENE